MNKLKKQLNAKVEHCPNCGKLKNKFRPCKSCGFGESGSSSIINEDANLNITEALRQFEDLKEGIEWRKAYYKQELDKGVDFDGIPLSETNRLIVTNLYNIMCALESYYKEDPCMSCKAFGQTFREGQSPCRKCEHNKKLN